MKGTNDRLKIILSIQGNESMVTFRTKNKE